MLAQICVSIDMFDDGDWLTNKFRYRNCEINTPKDALSCTAIEAEA